MSDSVHFTSDLGNSFSMKALSCQQRNCPKFEIVFTKEKQTQKTKTNWKPNLKLMLPFPVWAELNGSLCSLPLPSWIMPALIV